MSRRGSSFSFSEGEWKGSNRSFRTDRIVIKARVVQGTSDNDIGNVVKDILRHIGGGLVRRRPGDTLFVAEVVGGNIPAIAEDLMDPAVRSDVDFAEPDLRVRSSTYVPNDYWYKNKKDTVVPESGPAIIGVDMQWGPEKINAGDAWDLVPDPAKDLLIAVIDSGLSMSGGNFDHPELKDVRFEKGKNYVTEDGLTEADIQDEHYHGTQMTGIIAAATDNTISTADTKVGTTSKDFGTAHAEGMAGLNWASPVVIHRVLDAGRQLYPFDAATGAYGGIADVYDAVMEVKERVDTDASITRAVVNLSLGVTDDSSTTIADDGNPKTLEYMCRRIMDLPIILCCGTGNVSGDETLGDDVEHPARYAQHSEFSRHVISVGATGKGESDEEIMYEESKYVAGADYVTVVAPGADITSTLPTTIQATNQIMYGHNSGTSQATAHVTGVVSLIWSHNPNLAPRQVIEILKNTAVPLGSGSAPNDQWGYGRIDAGVAVSCAEIEVRADKTSHEFMNVEMQITEEDEVMLLIRSCASIEFQVTTAGYDFGIISRTITYYPSADSPPEEFERFLIGVASYTGNSDDPIAYGTVTIRQEGEADPIVVYITASTTGASNALISLVLDKSGSMGDPSGVGDSTRMEVLHAAAGIMVEGLRVNDAMGLVQFSDDANELVPVTTVVSNTDDPGKADLISRIEELGDDGLTAIGDGLEKANDQIGAELTANHDYTHKAIVVLTDGVETTGKYIDEVTVSHPVYAVAMGVETEVDTEKLNHLAGHTGGYLLMSGELDDFGMYRIAKYFLQILVGVSNEDIVKDPQGRILPEQKHVVPFDLTSADTRCDVFLLMPGMPGDDRDQMSGILDLRLITPDGHTIAPGDADGSSTVYRHGAFVSYYRLELPYTRGDRREHAGQWRARVTLDGQRFKQYLAWREERGDDVGPLRAHGVPYMLLMHARSNVRLEATLQQRGYRPGAPVTLRVRVLENGRPLDGLVTVKVRLSHPDRSESEFKIREVTPGTHEETRVASVAGTYSWHIVAEGRTRGGEWFTRERVATASVWA